MIFCAKIKLFEFFLLIALSAGSIHCMNFDISAVDNDRVREAIACGMNVNQAANKSGWTPLIFAVAGSQLETVQGLLAAGANPNHVAAGGLTPLHHAREVAIIKALLAYGANIDTQCENGDTPLHEHIFEPELAFCLLMHNPNLSLRNRNGQTPLGKLTACILFHDQFRMDDGRYVIHMGPRDYTEREHSGCLALRRIILEIMANAAAQCSLCKEKKNLTFWGLCGHQLCVFCKDLWMHSVPGNGILCPFCRQPGIEA